MALLIAVSTAYPVDEGLLSPGRRAKLAILKTEADRCRCRSAGAALDAALRTVGLREQDASIAYGEHGKPYLAEHPQWHFSLSHSGEWAVCVLSDAPVGVDVEQLRPIEAAALAKRWLPASQAETVKNSPIAEQTERFFWQWTRRESLLKAQGVGLSGLSSASEAGYRFREYSLEGYALTVCTAGELPEALQLIK